MPINWGPFGYICHHAQYCPVYAAQLESVPICSTVPSFHPSIPTQVDEVEPASPVGKVPQFAVGTIQVPDADVYVSPMST